MGRYNRNTEILKGFFRKPLTLVISILYSLSAIIPNIYMITKMVSSGVYDSAGFCAYSLLMILPAVAFLNLFIQGRKAAPISRLHTPLMLIYMYTVLSVSLSILCFGKYITDVFIEENIITSISFMFLLAVILGFALVILLQSISEIITFHSIEKSANGIYLCRKGSVFMGVTSFLAASAVILITLYFIDTSSYSRILDYSSMFDSVMLLLESAVLVALFVCLGIWSLMYSGAIKKAAVYLHGTDKKYVAKALTLADAEKAKEHSDNVVVRNPDSFVAQNPFDNHINQKAEPRVYQTTNVFSLPKQNEPNPYGNKKSAQGRSRQHQEDVPNHINFQNPYENFVPQNPFSNNNDK